MDPISFATRIGPNYGSAYVNTGQTLTEAQKAYRSTRTRIHHESIKLKGLSTREMHLVIAQHFISINQMRGSYMPKLDGDSILCVWLPFDSTVLLHAGENLRVPLEFASVHNQRAQRKARVRERTPSAPPVPLPPDPDMPAPFVPVPLAPPPQLALPPGSGVPVPPPVNIPIPKGSDITPHLPTEPILGQQVKLYDPALHQSITTTAQGVLADLLTRTGASTADDTDSIRITHGGRGGAGKYSVPLVLDLTGVAPASPLHIDDVEVSMYELPRDSGFAPKRYGVRLHHKPSGLEAQCGSKNNDHSNREVAWNVLDNLVQNWFYKSEFDTPNEPTLYGVPLTRELALKVRRLSGGSSTRLARFEAVCYALLQYLQGEPKTVEQQQAYLAQLLEQT